MTEADLIVANVLTLLAWLVPGAALILCGFPQALPAVGGESGSVVAAGGIAMTVGFLFDGTPAIALIPLLRCGVHAAHRAVVAVVQGAPRKRDG